MITDADIKKMKKVFATKDDLKTLRSEFIGKFATKYDLRESTNQLVELIMGGFDRIEKIVSRTNDHDEIIENHERRLDKIEDKVFA